jgi:hypothetical protein
MFYQRVLNFVYKCMSSESLLVNFAVRHGILHGQTDSIVGRNILHCCARYHTNIDNIINMVFQSHNITKHCADTVDDSIVVGQLTELLQCRDGESCLSDDHFIMSDIISMIDYLCTCWDALLLLFYARIFCFVICTLSTNKHDYYYIIIYALTWRPRPDPARPKPFYLADAIDCHIFFMFMSKWYIKYLSSSKWETG